MARDHHQEAPKCLRTKKYSQTNTKFNTIDIHYEMGFLPLGCGFIPSLIQERRLLYAV